jgi:hypothetical protein
MGNPLLQGKIEEELVVSRRLFLSELKPRLVLMRGTGACLHQLCTRLNTAALTRDDSRSIVR